MCTFTDPLCACYRGILVDQWTCFVQMLLDKYHVLMLLIHAHENRRIYATVTMCHGNLSVGSIGSCLQNSM